MTNCAAVPRERTRDAELLHEQHGAVDGIAGEDLVRAFAREHDDHLFARLLAQVIERDAGRVGDGLVEVPDELRQEVVEVLRA